MIYLDNAATTCPKPESVRRAMTNALKYACGNPGRSSHKMAQAAAEIIFDCRETIAHHFGGKTENVVFTYNTTYALNFAIKIFSSQNCHVIISDMEHNSVARPIYALSKEGLTYDMYCTDHYDKESTETGRSLLEKLRPNTKSVISTLASNICPIRPDAAEIGKFCQKHGLLFIADAAQFAGSGKIDINEIGIDILCAPGHKGLYGPAGCGFMIFSDSCAEKAVKFPTLIEGGSGIASLDKTMPDILPERFEAGTPAVPAIAGLAAGIRFVESIGVHRIFEYESALCHRLSDMLSTIKGIEMYCSDIEGNILLFNINGIPSGEAASSLEKYGICCRPGFHCSPLAHAKLGTGVDGALRLSFGVHNRERELESVYRAVKEIAAYGI